MGRVQKGVCILLTTMIFFAVAGYNISIAKTEDDLNALIEYLKTLE